MGFPVLAVKTIAELAFVAVPLIERMIRGVGRGKEKKEAAREFILEELQGALDNNPEALPDFANFDWIAAVADWSAIVGKVDDVIDSVVALLNALAKHNRSTAGSVSDSPLTLV